MTVRKMEDRRGPRSGRGTDEGKKNKAGMPEEWLTPLLLLCLRDGGSYDYRLKERLDEVGFDALGPEEMYRTLWRMEQEGAVLCDREGGGFRLPQRRYALTELGEGYLGFWADALGEHRKEMELFFRLYNEPSEQERGRG